MYFTRYREDVQAALEELREREFAAGRYNPVMPFPPCPPGPDSPAPGARHSSIQDVFQEAGEDGTRSILDLFEVSDTPGFFVAARLPDERLVAFYGTKHPTREMVEHHQPFFEDLERGHGVYFVLYEGTHPAEICFAGYSFD